MRKRSTKQRPGHIGEYWLSKKPGREGHNDTWCRTWFDERARQTRRLSLGATDFQEASLLLANWVVANARPQKAAANEVLIDTILLNYWNDYAKDLPSAKTQWNGLSYWQEFWTGRTVAKITPQEQRAFRQWLVKRGVGEGGIDRVLSTGRAALNRAHKWQELGEVPHIFGTLTAEAKRARAPMGHPITPLELARLFDAARSRHMLIYLLIASNTLARPSAILDLRRSQYDQTHKLLDLNPAGRKQNKKFRPIVPVSATLAPWLGGDHEPEVRYVVYRQKPIKSIKRMWHLTCEAAGLNDKLSPYSIRHGMAREMRKRRVPIEQISFFLGHLPKGSDATTSIYAPYEPDYCAEAVAAIESVMAEIRGHLKRANIDRPNPDAASVTTMIVDGRDNGVGNTKREEIRFLILSGLPHAEIVRRTGTSDGTVSLIRKQLRGVIPLFRNSESGLSVPFACRDEEIRDPKITQPIEIIGGARRIKLRTTKLTYAAQKLSGFRLVCVRAPQYLRSGTFLLRTGSPCIRRPFCAPWVSQSRERLRVS